MISMIIGRKPMGFNLIERDKRMLEKLRISVVTLALLFGASLSLAACDNNDGPMEEAGEAMDDAADDMGDAIEDATDN